MNVLLVLLVVCCYIAFFRGKRQIRLPPGPPSIPILGALFSLSTVRPWIVFRDWSQKHGSDILFVDIPNRPTIILNSYKPVYDLMEKRSGNYADRTPSLYQRLAGWDWALGFMPYGSRWRETRRVFHQHFSQAAVKKDRYGIIAREIHAFLQRAAQAIRDDPDACFDQGEVSGTFARSILDVVYGLQVEDDKNQLMTLSQQALELFNESMSHTFWTEYFPFLTYIPSWMPGPYRRDVLYARGHREIVSKTRKWGFDIATREFANGKSKLSMTQQLLQTIEDQHMEKETYEQQKGIAIDATGIAYATAVETQAFTLSAFLLGMAMNPDVQKKAQQDVDTVVGPNRLPTMADIADMPYVQAVFMESLRWMPVLPLNFPHDAMQDDEYEGYVIPRGYSVVVNIWAVLRDPIDYPNPDVFNPDRFILNGKINPDVREPTVAFGVGRRVCVGRYHAKDSLSLMIASILHVFNIDPVLKDGEQLTTSSRSGIIVQPENVPCRLTPRDAARTTLLQD